MIKCQATIQIWVRQNSFLPNVVQFLSQFQVDDANRGRFGVSSVVWKPVRFVSFTYTLYTIKAQNCKIPAKKKKSMKTCTSPLDLPLTKIGRRARERKRERLID